MNTIKRRIHGSVTGHTLTPSEEAAALITIAETADARRLKPAIRRASPAAVELARPKLRALGYEPLIAEARS